MEEELGTRYRCDHYDCEESVDLEQYRDIPDDWYEVVIAGKPPSLAGQHRRKHFHYCSFEHMLDGMRKRLDSMEQRRKQNV